VGGEQVGDLGGQVGLQQVASGQVHADRHRLALVHPAAGLGERSIQDVAGERADQAGVLGGGQERIRWQ